MDASPAITNEMLYELLKEFKGDFSDFKAEMREFKSDVSGRFRDQDRKITEFKNDVNKQFNDVNKQFEEVSREFDVQNKKINEIYRCRKEIKIKFTWKLAFAHVAISTGVSVVVFLLMSTFVNLGT